MKIKKPKYSNEPLQDDSDYLSRVSETKSKSKYIISNMGGANRSKYVDNYKSKNKNQSILKEKSESIMNIDNNNNDKYEDIDVFDF